VGSCSLAEQNSKIKQNQAKLENPAQHICSEKLSLREYSKKEDRKVLTTGVISIWRACGMCFGIYGSFQFFQSFLCLFSPASHDRSCKAEVCLF
jgi:hypothetical protein